MILLTIDELKQQCRVLSDDENLLLEIYGTAAEEYAAAYIGRPLVAEEPASIKAACLMLAATMYAYRESESVAQTHELRACKAMLDPHYVGGFL